jgi:hypothetical protein
MGHDMPLALLDQIEAAIVSAAERATGVQVVEKVEVAAPLAKVADMVSSALDVIHLPAPTAPVPTPEAAPAPVLRPEPDQPSVFARAKLKVRSFFVRAAQAERSS